MAILLLIFPALMVEGRNLRSDPVSGRVRVIYMGKIVGSPFPVLSLEPSLSCTAVYACTFTQHLDTIRKSIRNYLPRTYSRFLGNDVIVLCDANKNAFRSDHYRWMKDGVLEEGQGLVMVGGAESFAGDPSWRPTEVADILPCEMMEDYTHSGGSIKIIDHNDEFIMSLPFERLGAFGFFHSSNNIQPRGRANLIAVLQRPTGVLPFLMWWDIGKGRTMAQSAGWQPVAGNIFMRWEYYGDYAINMMLYLAGQTLPDDLEMVYLARRRMREVNEDLNILYDLIDMVEKFGGSGYSLNRIVSDIQEEKERAVGLYVEARLDESLDGLNTVLKMGKDAMREAIKARDAAALWIFVTEWAAVTGTSMLAGAILWALMIKRRLFREVEITRLSSL